MTRPFYPLHRAELRQGLDTGEAMLRRLMQSRSLFFEAKRVIVSAEREHGFVYRLTTGWCARIRYLRDGRAQVLAILLPGDLFAVTAMLLDKEADDIVALTDITVDAIDRDALLAEAMGNPDLLLRLTWQLSEDVRRTHNWLVALSNGKAEERIALLLLDVRGRLILSGELARDAGTIPWPLTQQQMADIIGLTAVHVNRTARQMRETGLADISRHGARLDVARLHAVARPLLDVFEKSAPAFGAAAA